MLRFEVKIIVDVLVTEVVVKSPEQSPGLNGSRPYDHAIWLHFASLYHSANKPLSELSELEQVICGFYLEFRWNCFDSKKIVSVV